MIIVSAGVIMNVILAAIGFMIVFMLGYPVPPATVGSVVAISPAAQATRVDGTLVGLQPGDKIINYDGKEMGGDFSRIPLDVALTRDGTRVPIFVRTPGRQAGNTLRHARKTQRRQRAAATRHRPALRDDMQWKLIRKIRPITPCWPRRTCPISAPCSREIPSPRSPAKTLTPTANAAIAQLFAAMEASDGKPVPISPSNRRMESFRTTTVTPHFGEPFGGQVLNFLGMVPRASVVGLLDKSPALDKLKPGDAILAVDARIRSSSKSDLRANSGPPSPPRATKT